MNERWSILVFTVILFTVNVRCSILPGSVKKLERKGIKLHAEDFEVDRARSYSSSQIEIIYLGCGGLYLVREGAGILIDPFFSNQKMGRIGRSLFLNHGFKKNLRPDPKMIRAGLNAMDKINAKDSVRLISILNSHSHYDHLMDIPYLYQHFGKGIPLLLNESGYNIIHAAIDTTDAVILEHHATTSETQRPPIEFPGRSGAVRIYPILSDHNPHFRNIKFFSGSQSSPVKEYSNARQKTNANLWLEGNTFSFLIDYLDRDGKIDFRIFVQSSSCNPPAGIPPHLGGRNVDLAFLGIVSYHFSPNYPCALLDVISPGQVVWVHWEDFFRKYTKPPKTIRGTDIPGFFELPCVRPYKNSGKLMSPGVKMRLLY